MSSWSNIASVMESILRKILVSSAKHATVEFVTASGKSFTYRRKSIGPKILPCGTPEHTGFLEEVAPRVVTRCWRSYRYDVNHWTPSPVCTRCRLVCLVLLSNKVYNTNTNTNTNTNVTA